MDPARRHFLLRGASVGTNALTLSHSQSPSLLRAIWQVASRLSVRGIVIGESHWNLSGLLSYSKSFLMGLDNAALAAHAKDSLGFVSGMNRSVQDLFWFSLNEDLARKTWHDIYHDHHLLVGALRHHLECYADRLQFSNLEELKSSVKWLANHKDFRGAQPSGMESRAYEKIVQLLQDHGELLRGFDWTGFAQNSEDDIEVVYQLLIRFRDHMPSWAVDDLSVAYSRMAIESDNDSIRYGILRKAAMVLRWLTDQDPPKWSIEPAPRQWDDWKLIYRVTAITHDKNEGHVVLTDFIKDMTTRFGMGIVFAEIVYDESSSLSSLLVTAGEEFESDFEYMCGVSLLHANEEFMAEVLVTAEQERVRNNQIQHDVVLQLE